MLLLRLWRRWRFLLLRGLRAPLGSDQELPLRSRCCLLHSRARLRDRAMYLDVCLRHRARQLRERLPLHLRDVC